MFDGDRNIESTKPAAKAIDLPDLDRLPASKPLTQKSDVAKKTAGDVSLDNLHTSSLYESSQTAASGPAHQHSKTRDGQQNPSAIAETRHASTIPEVSIDVPPAQSNKLGAQRPEVHAGNVFHQTDHTLKHGETVEAVSRRFLGPKASEQDVVNYSLLVNQINGINDPRYLRGGDKLTMPGRDSKGAFTFVNADNRDEHCQINSDGSYEVHNVRTKTHSLQTSLDYFGSLKTEHKGPLPNDNYDETFVHKDHYTLTTRKESGGKTIATGSDGFVKVTDKHGNWVSDAPQNLDPYHASYDKASGLTTQYMSDGAVIKVFDKDKHSEAIEPNGTKTSKFQDGSVKVEKRDTHGSASGSYMHPDGKGGYSEHGWGPTPKDNYDETYSARSGITSRTEGKGRAEEKTSTITPDGTVTVLSKDGKNFRRNADGSEHHWGAENFDKPPFDYKHNETVNTSRERLRGAMHDHIPSARQAAFQKDMVDFEARVRKEHLPPEEIAKTYDQISRVLDAPDKTAVVSATNRAMLAEGLMHQSAHVQDTDQGNHNTCNVTTALKITLRNNPSKTAEMAATTAINGAWTSPDGKTVQIDRSSLQPQAEESTFPPHPGDRSYATQVLNLVMVNDALHRRPSPLTYVQRTPEGPDDTGERRLDSKQKVVMANQYDAKADTWKVSPDASPGLTDSEVIASARRLNGDVHLIAVNDPQAGVDSVTSEQGFADKLQQFKNQQKLPVILGVDGHHVPVQDLGNESPSYGAHFVNVGAYEQRSGRVHVENQWGKQSNRWVNIKHLYNNASGNMSSEQDGVDTADYQ